MIQRHFSLVLIAVIGAGLSSYGQIRSDSVFESERIKFLSQRWAQALKTPVMFMGAGVIALTDNDILSSKEYREERQENIPNFHAGVDDYIQFAPIATVFVFDILGLKSKNNLKSKAAILIKSELLMMAMVVPTKKLTHVLRPDGSAFTSFPSGHTAQAFVAASFFHHEYGHLGRWVTISAYTMASSVGILRVLNDRHWTSDVLVGAGIGILSSNIASITNKSRNKAKNKRMKLLALPTFSGNGYGAMIRLKF